MAEAARFRISLPCRTIERAILRVVTGSRSVLVVDDDAEFRGLARRLLGASGLTVVGEADSVAGALSDAERLKPTAFLVDVELPDGDGFALARQLAALPWRPRIVMTSIDGDITAEEAHHAGALAFVNKADLPSAPLGRLLGGECLTDPTTPRYG